MSVTVAEGVVIVTADAKDVTKDIARAIDRGQDDVKRSGRRTGDGWVNSFKGSFLGNALADIAGNVVNFVGNAISAGVQMSWDLAWSSIDIASGINEAQTAIDSVFGAAGSAAINDFADSAAKTIGQSRLDALKAAQTFGVYGQAAGLAGEANAGFSADLVSLASDFASFYDTSPEEAIEAIGAALRGEAEPLRRYGVLLDDARLRQEAMELGIYDGNGSLTSQQRILAANRAIFEDAGVALGDYAATSDSAANQQRELAASFEDAKGKLGEALLPVLTDFLHFANDELIPVLDDLIEDVGPGLATAFSEGAPIVMDFVRDLAEAIPGLVEDLNTFVEWLNEPTTQQGLNDFGIIVGEVGNFAKDTGTNFMDTAGLVGIAVGIINGERFDDIVARLDELPGFWGSVWHAARDTAVNVGSSVGTMIYNVRQFAYDIGSNIGIGVGEFRRFSGEVGTNIYRAVAFVGELPGRALSALGNVGSILYSSGRSLVQGFLNGLKSMWDSITSTVGGIVSYVAGFFPNSPAKYGAFSGDGWTNLKRSGGAIMDQFGLGMEEAAPDVPFDLLGLGGGAGRPVSSPRGPGYGGNDRPPTRSGDMPAIIINEATDPLGTAGRVSVELRKWKRRGA